MTTREAKDNIPSPDPSVATNERLEHAITGLRVEVKEWVDSLQVQLEGTIAGGFTNVKTRLDGNDTALVAALKAQKEEAANQTGTFKEVLAESKKGTEKQIDALNEKIDDLKERMTDSGGRQSGMGTMAAVIIATIAAMAAMVSAYTAITRPAPAPYSQGQRL